MNSQALAGKAIVVTGAGRGLGRAYATHAAGAGAAVVVNDIDAQAAEDTASAIRAEGARAVAHEASVTEPESAASLVDLCVSRFDRLDGLVNNAGVLFETAAWETTPEQVRAMVEVNLMGSIFCGHAAIAALRAQDTGGSIVNVTSGTQLGQPGLAVYGATKGAIASLTYGWALDLDGTGIRANAVSPLAVTEMKLPPYDGHALPEDIASVVTYLLSDAAAGITGQVVRRARGELGLMRHPAIGTMISGDWCLDEIVKTFDSVLSAELEPVGFGAHVLDPRTSS